MTEDFETFGPEWKAAVMKIRKEDIVNIFSKSGKEKEALLALVKEAREALNYYFLPTHRKNEDIEMVKMQDLLSKIDKTLES